MGSLRRIVDSAIIVLFALGIGVPMAGGIVGRKARVAYGENRALAPKPALPRDRAALSTFPARFEAYYADRFGFRGTLLGWNSVAKASWLGISPTPKVAIGRDGWLFLAEHAMDEYVAARPLPASLLAEWQATLQARNDWLARRGVHFLVVFAPDTQTIYPEYLPARIHRLGSASRLDQLVDWLGTRSRVPVVDLRDDLRRAKAHERVYQRTGSHWNERGAFVAYQRVIEALRPWYPELSALPREAFEDAVEEGPGSDLARMMGLRDVLPEEYLLLRPRAPRRAHEAAAGFRMPRLAAWRQPRALETADAALPRAIVLRDSFAGALIPFLSEHFARVLYPFTEDLDPVVVERERPGVVIEEFVERRLMRGAPANRPELARAETPDGPRAGDAAVPLATSR